MKCFALACLAFAFVCAAGCKKEEVLDPVCKLANKTIYGAAQGVAEVLTCSNPAAIAADMAAPIYKLNLCSVQPAGLVGDLVCPQITKTVIAIGIGALPGDWGCTGGVGADKLEASLIEACKKYIKY